MLNWDIEAEQAAEGYKIICGVDEAGRGSLAGPVAAAACVLPFSCIIEGLRDSKKLSESKRERLFNEITAAAVDYGIDFASVEEIDSLNILNASMLAMKRAVEKLKTAPDLLLIDGVISRGFVTDSLTIVKGDNKSPMIAAASVLAKVSRDRVCYFMDKMYPEYGIARHKGYGTRVHMDMLKKYGPSPIHRVSFLKFLHNDHER